MVTKTTAEEIPAMKENFAELFNEMFGEDKGLEGSVVKGTIVALNDDFVTIDVGLKSEGRIARREFGFNAEMKVGDQVDVFIDRYEDKDGMVVLSREKARREEAWNELEKRRRTANALQALFSAASKAALRLICPARSRFAGVSG